MSRRRAPLLVSLVVLVALGLAHPATAQFFGDRTEAQDCASAVGGNVSNSTVSIACGIPPERVSEFMRLAVSGRPGDYTELLRRLDALIPTTSRLRAEALARFFAILGEADVPPERLTERLVEIAGSYQKLRGQLENISSVDPEVRRLKEQARAALDAGDFARTEALLNQAKARDLSAVNQMQAAIDQMQDAIAARKLSAAEAAAGNGALMVTQLRYAEAAQYYAEATALDPDNPENWTLLCVLLNRLGRLDDAAEAAKRVLELGHKRNDETLLATAYNELGLIAGQQGNLDQAQQYHQQALSLHEKLNQREGIARQYSHFALIAEAKGDLKQAEQYLLKAMKLHEELGHKIGIANNYGNLGLIARQRNDLDLAEEYFRKALVLQQQTGQIEDVASTLNNLGSIALQLGETDIAEKYFRNSLELHERLEHKAGIAAASGTLGLLAQGYGDLKRADEYFQQALKLYGEIGDKRGMSTAYTNLGVNAQGRGNLDLADNYHRQSLLLNQESKNLSGLAHNHANFGGIAASRGDITSACKYWREAYDLHMQIGSINKATQVKLWMTINGCTN